MNTDNHGWWVAWLHCGCLQGSHGSPNMVTNPVSFPRKRESRDARRVSNLPEE